jgi:hypothetical protein
MLPMFVVRSRHSRKVTNISALIICHLVVVKQMYLAVCQQLVLFNSSNYENIRNYVTM